MMNAAANTLEARVAELEDQIKQLTWRLAHLDQDITRHEHKLTYIECSKIRGLENDVADLERRARS